MAKNNQRQALASIFLAFALAFSLASGLDISLSTRAQEVSPQPAPATQAVNKIELHQALLDLTNPWTVMCIAAHPDDEDGTSLIVMRRKYGAHTVSLFSTFGEGGQNAIGPELYEELGAIRARETMAAAEIQGSEPYFLGLKDFGFSKSVDETFRVWGHDEALRRMVLQIRKLRPDVIITNHSATNNDHGHHQATARLELEAFDAAADPKRFPEQLKDGVTVWQVQRLFVRAGRSNQAQAETAPLVTIDPNEIDHIRGKVYAEEALQALQKHATQGPWPKTVAQMAARFANSSDGRLPLIRYRLVREAKGAQALPKESHDFLDGLRLPEEIAKRLQPPTIDGRPLSDFANQPDLVFDSISTALRTGLFAPGQYMELLVDDRHLDLINARTHAALAAASGITGRLNPREAVVIPGEEATFDFVISNDGRKVATLYFPKIKAFEVEKRLGLPVKLLPGSSLNGQVTFRVPANTELSIPASAHLYDNRWVGQQIWSLLYIDTRDGKFFLHNTSHVDVAPAVEVGDISPSPFVITSSTVNSQRSLIVKLVNHRHERFAGNLFTSTGASETFGGIESRIALSLARAEGRDVSIPMGSILSPRLNGKSPPNVQGTLSFSISQRHKLREGEQIQRLIPLAYADARVAPNVRVGYIRGFDYSLPNALAALGVESKELSVDEVKTAYLQKYSTIIVDNRVYESQPDLIAANQRLLDYTKGGGTLIVFYHKSFEWNPDERRKRPQLAPYKLMLGDERITDETAPITFLEPQHPLLNLPNKIGPEDFANWIQERGLYYPKDWDPQYHALLQSNDPGEAPLKGGLLVADYGRGHYIYTSMVWYRELRAGVPGAYRVFANMISYGHK